MHVHYQQYAAGDAILLHFDGSKLCSFQVLTGLCPAVLGIRLLKSLMI